jgi:hypothetical protein
MLVTLFLTTLFLNAQDTISSKTKQPNTAVGFGVGLDYGGYGANVLVHFTPSIGIFGGFGNALIDFGYNVGIKAGLIPNKRTPANVFACLMYGYNTIIKVSGASQYNKIFYGFSLGGGLDFRIRKKALGYFNITLFYPIRGDDVKNYIDDLNNNHNVKGENDLFPLAGSFGYHFVIPRR